MIRTNNYGILSRVAQAAASLNVTIVNTTPYSVAMNDMILAVDATSGPITILLPSLPMAPREITIVDSFGMAGENNITIQPFAGDTILGATGDVILMTQNISATFVNTSSSNWSVISKN